MRRPGAFAGTLIASAVLHAGAVVWMQFPAAAEPPETPPPLLVNLAPLPEPPAAEPEPVFPPPPPEAPPLRQTPPPEPPPEPERVPVEAETVAPVPAPVKLAAAPAPAETSPAETSPAEAVADPKIEADYEHLVVAWLNRHKRYPRVAERRRLEGECLVRLKLARSGRVLAAALAKECGYPPLDAAALEMVRRAGVFPPFPEDKPGTEAEYLIPVAFSLD